MDTLQQTVKPELRLESDRTRNKSSLEQRDHQAANELLLDIYTMEQSGF